MPKEYKELLATTSGDKWKRIGVSRRAGILAPLFSVYSKESAGIGDLADLKILADLCVKTGASIIQLLPMNEIGSTFCPYDAISSFAIEPSYISLSNLPGGLSAKKPVKDNIEKLRKAYPSKAGYVDYAVKDAKKDVLWEAYLHGGDLSDPGFRKFAEANKYWLNDFTLYKAIKNHQAGKPWYEWPEEYSRRDPAALSAYGRKYDKEVSFHKWAQYIAFCQFKEAREYAASKGVLLKGDLPILISRDSADVWARPEFFKLDFLAGAPPDTYCAKGQRWGMPTYDWDAIADDKFRYVKEKLKYAGNLYDMLRIDHVVGLFRIWSIPKDDPAENEGLNGVFDPKDEKMWGEHGRLLLSTMLENTDMLLCAEDLGIIPKDCPATLKEMGIPGNEVERWVKDWEKRHDFLPPDEYRPVSVAMLSTHDTTNWAAWWENEAGTVDEALFMRKCRDRGIDFERIKDNLFDASRSRHGRLRWQDIVKSKEIYTGILGKKEEELRDFIEMYENTYHEKEKLWKHLGLKGPMRERSDEEIVKAALSITLASRSVFCIELIIDYLYTAGMFKGDPYRYRINKPGTVAKTNWSLTMPMALEDLLKDKVCRNMKELISDSGRAA